MSLSICVHIFVCACVYLGGMVRVSGSERVCVYDCVTYRNINIALRRAKSNFYVPKYKRWFSGQFTSKP